MAAKIINTMQQGVGMNIDQATNIFGGPVPATMIEMSAEYCAQILKREKQQDRKNIEAAYRTMAAQVLATQIAANGRFDPTVDFSTLDDIQVFKGENGVIKCPSCNGVGGLVKFHKKPREVQCLKCRTLKITLDDQSIVINEETIEVDGVDKTNDVKYTWLLGKRVETCQTCGGSGRYVDRSLGKDLIINVRCKTCNGQRYTPEIAGTQVLIKCRTCHGNRKLKIPVLIGLIKDVTPCRVCDGRGYTRPYTPDNPVLTKQIAESITDL